MAEQHDIPVELLAKVLQRLARRGCSRPCRGFNGGYRSRGPPRVSVADVVEAIDGPLTLTACSDTSDSLRSVREVQHPGPAASHPRADRSGLATARWPNSRGGRAGRRPSAAGGIAIAGRAQRV